MYIGTVVLSILLLLNTNNLKWSRNAVQAKAVINHDNFSDETLNLTICFLPFQGLFEPSITFYTLILSHIVVLLVLSYLVLYWFGTNWFTGLFSLALFSVAQVSSLPYSLYLS